MISALSSFPVCGGGQAISVAANGTLTTGATYISTNQQGRICLVINVGAVGAGGIVTITFAQATAAAGTGTKALSAGSFGSMSTLTAAGNVQLEFDPKDMDWENGFSFLQVTLTVTVATILLAMNVFRVDPDRKSV